MHREGCGDGYGGGGGYGEGGLGELRGYLREGGERGGERRRWSGRGLEGNLLRLRLHLLGLEGEGGGDGVRGKARRRGG